MSPTTPIDADPSHPGTPITERETWWQKEVERLKTELEKAGACCAKMAPFIDEVSIAIQHPTLTADERLACIKKAGARLLPAWRTGQTLPQLQKEFKEKHETRLHNQGVPNPHEG